MPEISQKLLPVLVLNFGVKFLPFSTVLALLLGSEKISLKFFRPTFFRGRPCGMSMPRCLFFFPNACLFQDLESLTEVSAGMSKRKLPLLVVFVSDLQATRIKWKIGRRCGRGSNWD